MPVVDSNRYSCSGLGSADWPRRKPLSEHPQKAGESLAIGLINNMPHSAFAATERQFISILDRASEDIPIHLSFYSLVGAPARAGGADEVHYYSNIDELWETNLDGLIVTGKEPITANLQDEPCWETLTRVLEWARENTSSTVWSCLAAHAAVLYLDGIRRHKNEQKQFGVFECHRVSTHQLLSDGPQTFQIPHSRWNSLSEEDLVSRGYSILTHIEGLGVDTFVKEENSLFVFFQGHPEYDSDTLLREYRRDVTRYLNHESANHPFIPAGYFDSSMQRALTALRDEAVSTRNPEILASLCSILEKAIVRDTWKPTTACLYRNWIDYIYARKSQECLAGVVSVA